MSNRIGSKETRRMAHEVENRLNHEFRRRFSNAGDESLLRYVAECARQIGGAPSYADIIGADVLQKRFERWSNLLDMLCLCPLSREDRRYIPSLFTRLVEDMEVVQKQTLRAMRQNEKDFAQNHEGDSDEELFAYIRLWHKRLKHIPNHFEIVGGEYIKKRFKNDWHRVLHLAGLRALPDSPPKTFRRLIYLDELKKQMNGYVENYLAEISRLIEGKEDVYNPQACKAAV